MSTVLTDEDAKTAIAQNVSRILSERGRTAYWLMKQLGLKQGTLYPVVRGEVVPSVAVTARIAEVLDTTVDELIRKNSRKLKNSA